MVRFPPFTKTKGDLLLELKKVKLDINKSNNKFELAERKRKEIEEDCVSREIISKQRLQIFKKKGDDALLELKSVESLYKDGQIEINKNNAVLEAQRLREREGLKFLGKLLINGQKLKREENNFKKRLQLISIELADEIKNGSYKINKLRDKLKIEKKKLDKVQEFSDEIKKQLIKREDKIKEREKLVSRRERDLKIYYARIKKKFQELFPNKPFKVL